MMEAASGRGGRSSQASLMTSYSWSDDFSTEAALAALSRDELQHTELDLCTTGIIESFIFPPSLPHGMVLLLLLSCPQNLTVSEA